MQNTFKITFCGGTGSVTGANFLLEIDNKKILIDCGLTQGTRLADNINWEPFPYDPKEIDILFITHAHIDHLGRIPKLIHEGFRGKIYSTEPTKDLAVHMLEDTATILGRSRYFDLSEIYKQENIRLPFSLWESFEYNKKFKITENLEFVLLNAGHILGSAMVEFIYQGKKILFTGDLGKGQSLLLPDAEKITDIDYLIMESVYGDRNHEANEDRKKVLQEIVEDNYRRKGTLIIPTFSLERSQELLFEFNNLVENNLIPKMSIFLDSPLAIRLTEIFKKYKDYLNEDAKKVLSKDKYIFDFPGLRSTLRSKESKMILEAPEPKIIIAGSGMSSGGRIIHHEKNYLPNPNNTILLIGYQAVGTIGRLIQEGIKTVKINDEYVKVAARVANIYGYSGHKDSDGLLDFISDSQNTLKKVFLVMGEPRAANFLAQRIKDNLNLEVQVPRLGESVIITI